MVPFVLTLDVFRVCGKGAEKNLSAVPEDLVGTLRITLLMLYYLLYCVYGFQP